MSLEVDSRCFDQCASKGNHLDNLFSLKVLIFNFFWDF